MNLQIIKLALELTGRHTDSITLRSEVPQVGIEKYTAVIRQVAEWEQERFGHRD